MLKDMARRLANTRCSSFFTISYVALAAFVGALADSMAKWRVMLISNGIKVVAAALLMFAHVHPLLAYAVVGLGAAAYSPAKYGILTEYLPHRLLVVANGWIEGLTVGAIILGVLMGGLLIRPDSLSVRCWAIDLPMIDTGLDTTVEISLAIVGGLYLLAASSTCSFPTPACRTSRSQQPALPAARLQPQLLRALARQAGADFTRRHHAVLGRRCDAAVHRDRLGRPRLGMGLSQASKLQGVVASASRRRGHGRAPHHAAQIGARDSARHRDGAAGSADGSASQPVAGRAAAGPDRRLRRFLRGADECLLQHRGHMLMGAGHSIAVQNFNENLSILIMTGTYALMIMLGPVDQHRDRTLFGLFVSGTMCS
jgi:LPLT family lysophospholipid transporter-like MFS transporter